VEGLLAVAPGFRSQLPGANDAVGIIFVGDGGAGEVALAGDLPARVVALPTAEAQRAGDGGFPAQRVVIVAGGRRDRGRALPLASWRVVLPRVPSKSR
jgi:hypothetical protein